MPQSFGVNAMALFQKPAIGLDISDHSIEAVFIVRRSDRLVVSSYGRTTLPPGAIVDGYVERPELVRLAIRKLLADQMVPPLPRSPLRVVFALPESQVYSHIFEVPRVADDAQLGRSLAIEADGYFPYPHDEMAADYAVIAQRPDRKDIYYAAVHKDTLKRYLSLFASVGLAIDAVENESASVARAALSRDETDPVMFVDIGARVTNVSVFDRDGIQFSEALETAGDAFTQALAQALAISTEDADSLKRNRGLSEDLDLTAQKALRAQVDRLGKDVAAARDYYEGKSKRLIARAVLCGGSTLMPGLIEAIATRLSVPGRGIHVESVDPWVGLEMDPTLEKLGLRERGVLAATAVGLALRG
ncbi:MAG TPA: type IV pilus assembly protein PilM, partial [Patescibacteria group bacterium]|nr:type IV pilus assembly protein PilM [Patescibacteria group bacterium]